MGLEFIRNKGASFTQRRDQSKLTELDTADLLSTSKPDHVVRYYSCICTDTTAEIIPGLGLTAKVNSPSEVVMLKHGKPIGHLLPEEVAGFISAMRKNAHLGGVLSVTIVEPPGWDGVFTVKPKVAFKK